MSTISSLSSRAAFSKWISLVIKHFMIIQQNILANYSIWHIRTPNGGLTVYPATGNHRSGWTRRSFHSGRSSLLFHCRWQRVINIYRQPHTSLSNGMCSTFAIACHIMNSWQFVTDLNDVLHRFYKCLIRSQKNLTEKSRRCIHSWWKQRIIATNNHLQSIFLKVLTIPFWKLSLALLISMIIDHFLPKVSWFSFLFLSLFVILFVIFFVCNKNAFIF